MNMNARIVGESGRADACLPTGGSGPAWRTADPVPGRPRPEDPETAVLASITSRYEDARARIIAAAAPSPAGRHTADRASEAGPAGPMPTVPVELAAVLSRARPLPGHLARSDPAPLTRETAATQRWHGLVRSVLSRLGTPVG